MIAVAGRLLLLAALAACSSTAGDESLGDAAVAAGRWAEAQAAYAAAGSDVRVVAKRASVAIEAERPGGAALAWTEVAERDSSRRGEAAAGLVRAALQAQADGDMLSLASAVRGLRSAAPSWPVGRLALPLRLAAFPSAEDALALGPAILAAVPGRDVADEVLMAMAVAWRRQDRCDRAAPIFDALSRRLEGIEARGATEAYALCRLDTGLASIAAADYAAAIGPLGDAANRDPQGAVGRRALVALGDVHLQMGDVFAAQLAWRTAAAAGPALDSITTLALERLRAAAAGDTTGDTGLPR